MHTYARQPVSFTHGKGAWLWDTEGRQYLDAVAGVAVCSLGHAHPAVAAAIADQAATLVHTSNIYRIPLQEQLGEKLCALSGLDKVFFCNSGAEANEAAIKIARRAASLKNIDQPMIVVMEGSFHGRTLATLSATGNRKVQAGFEPLVQGFVRVPYNDLDSVRAVARNTPNVVAVLVEPVQGEGGVVIPDAGYLRGLREICDAQGWLLMLDEIQTGMGRTGRWFACQHEDVLPDVMTLAKALGNGMPIGACLARGAAADLLQPGMHGSTFGGNPLACRAALAVIAVHESEGIATRAASTGDALAAELRRQLDGLAAVREVRNRGMMIGVELDRPCAALVGQALADGLLINVTAERVIRLLPPLNLTAEEVQRIADLLGALVRRYLAETRGAA